VPSTVKVPQLIALESYGVHNLVTTVSGQLAPQIGAVEAVKRCFPPGSMTGAPKLRSVQLLDGFEEHYPRGIYSGALGYFSMCGSADLSVVIRTMVLEGDREFDSGGTNVAPLFLRPNADNQNSASVLAALSHGSRSAKASGPRSSPRSSRSLGPLRACRREGRRRKQHLAYFLEWTLIKLKFQTPNLQLTSTTPPLINIVSNSSNTSHASPAWGKSGFRRN
jgi:hypothetical protein